MKRYLKSAALLALFSTLALSVLGFFSDVHLLFDLASHFKVHYLVFASLAFAVFLIYRALIFSILSVSVFAVNLTAVLPWYFDDSAELSASADPSIKLFLSNVYAGNTAYEKVISFIQNENPDVVVAMEVNGPWVSELELLNTNYRYSSWVPRGEKYGIAVYSRLPILSETVEFFENPGIPSLVLTLDAGSEVFTLIATHPLPPLNENWFRLRDKQLSNLGKKVESVHGPLVLAGDLNTTMWSTQYKKLEETGNLRNARQGFGIKSTWPSQLSMIGVPIDHVLVSEHFKVTGFELGDHVGSDHLPLIVELALW